MRTKEKARIWMAMASWAASVAVLASASGCAVVNSNGELTGNGKFWLKAGRQTDRLVITEPYVHPEAHLAETHFAGDPAAPCPQSATVGSSLKERQPVPDE